MAYSLIERMAARRLYVQAGYTFRELSKETRISVSQLKKWAAADRWGDFRRKLERAVAVGDSAAIYRQKAELDRVVRLAASINRRRKRWQVSADPEQPPDLTADDLTRKRLSAGLSQRDLAQRLGISEKKVSAFEQGYQKIPRLVSIACSLVLRPRHSFANAV